MNSDGGSPVKLSPSIIPNRRPVKALVRLVAESDADGVLLLRLVKVLERGDVAVTLTHLLDLLEREQPKSEAA